MHRPNVVLVVVDTLRAASVDEEIAPTLAELGRQGTSYTNAFSTSPWTVPSHASLFTGAYPSQHGTHGDHPAIRDSVRTLPACFERSGYETFGISNNTWISGEFGFDRGFEEFKRGWQYIQSETDMGAFVRAKTIGEKIRRSRRLLDGNPVVNIINALYGEMRRHSGDDGAAWSNERVRRWLGRRDEDRPFFLFLNYLEPHLPYDPPESYAEPHLPAGVSYDEASNIPQSPRAYDVGASDLTASDFAALRGLYRGEISYVDDMLGELCRDLEKRGVWDDTVVVVCGDHGESIGDNGFFGHQYNLFDPVLNVPLVIVGGAFEAGGVNRELVQLVDLPVTLLDAAGVEAAEFRDQQQGGSLHPDIARRSRDRIFAEYVSPQPPLSVLESRFDDVPERVRNYYHEHRTIRTHRWKLVSGNGSEHLCRVDTEDTEATDVSHEHPETTQRLREELSEWERSFDRGIREDHVDIDDPTLDRLAELGYR